MPADKALSKAVFESITESSYPEDENIVSADLSSPALQRLSQLLEQARADVKTSISELSKLSASDIDGWIGQARQLRTDIDTSQQRSKDIAAFAEQGGGLHEKAKDAATKAAFLRNEVTFNDSLVTTLKTVQEVKGTADAVQRAIQSDELLRATKLLEDSKSRLDAIPGIDRTKFKNVLSGRLGDLRDLTAEKLTGAWNALISIDTASASVSVQDSIERKSGPLRLEEVATALATLDLLQLHVETLHKNLNKVIFEPFLRQQSNSPSVSIEIEGQTISIRSGSAAKSLEALFTDLEEALALFQSHLPPSVSAPLAQALTPSLITQLLSGPLANAVPAELDGIPRLQDALSKVIVFADFVAAQGWHGHTELMKWVDNAPSTWLMKRSQSSLSSIRQLLKRGLGNARAVERVETQKVSTHDEAFAEGPKQDDWNDGWSDGENEEQPPVSAIDRNRASSNAAPADEDDDVSGWGFDDDEGEKQPANATASPDGNAKAAAEEEEGDAWGWGDEDEHQNDSGASPRKTPVTPRQFLPRLDKATNGTSPVEREVTLKETYHITSVPEQVLEIIILAVEDADSLARAGTSNPIAPAAQGLYSLPGQSLSMFRASAPNFYGNDANGNMYLYNDCLYTAEQLRSFTLHRQSRSHDVGGDDSLKLQNDISALEVFGRRAYGREMESQRTIFTDLLDGAQGFANCTESPFAQECDTAISSTIDRIRELHRQWSSVLSKSALLQSIGSLLTTITNKIIVDIEDMSDISEPESQRLTSFCSRITALDDLFLPEQASNVDSDDQPVPLTAGYTSSWLKFQYLANILESSLIDIKFLWTEGELSLEFSADEVVDLIEALFADSDHRRRAIQEIRRGAR